MKERVIDAANTINFKMDVKGIRVGMWVTHVAENKGCSGF